MYDTHCLKAILRKTSYHSSRISLGRKEFASYIISEGLRRCSQSNLSLIQSAQGETCVFLYRIFSSNLARLLWYSGRIEFCIQRLKNLSYFQTIHQIIIFCLKESGVPTTSRQASIVKAKCWKTGYFQNKYPIFQHLIFRTINELRVH